MDTCAENRRNHTQLPSIIGSIKKMGLSDLKYFNVRLYIYNVCVIVCEGCLLGHHIRASSYRSVPRILSIFQYPSPFLSLFVQMYAKCVPFRSRSLYISSMSYRLPHRNCKYCVVLN